MVKGDLGTQLKREPIHIWLHKKHKPPVRKHGDIQGFSENSRSRLRVLLSTAKWNGGKCRRYGLTLTLPWAAKPKEWRVVWSRFMKRLSTKHSNVAVIWRIELTTGKAERSGGLRRCHVHAMVWLPVDCVLSKEDAALLNTGNVNLIAYLNLETICKEWISAWQSFNPSLDEKQMLYACSFGESKGHGIVTKRLDDSKDGAIHYLCDHASKHKQEQLGWNGRQWGVINRACFSFPSESDGEKVSGEDWAIASRQLRRLNVAKRRAGDKWSQPYGDNKCHFGKAESNLHHVLDAVWSGKIGRVGR